MSALGGEIARTVGLIGAALLCAAGAGKLWRPAVTAKALEAARLPARRAPIRALALAELVVGVVYFASPGIASVIALSVVYSFFTAFTVRVLRLEGAAVPCGCAAVLGQGRSFHRTNPHLHKSLRWASQRARRRPCRR